jgi:hypothetical protein
VTERGVGSASQHCRKPVTLAGQLRPADGEDAAVNDVQEARSNPAIDSVILKAERAKLRTTDDPMLPPSKAPEA